MSRVLMDAGQEAEQINRKIENRSVRFGGYVSGNSLLRSGSSQRGEESIRLQKKKKDKRKAQRGETFRTCQYLKR